MPPVLSYDEFDQCAMYELRVNAYRRGRGPEPGIPPERYTDYLYMDKSTTDQYRPSSGNHAAQSINLTNVSMPAETFETLINAIKNVAPNPINPTYQQSNRFVPRRPTYTPAPRPAPRPSYRFTNYNGRGGFGGRGRGNHHHHHNNNNNNNNNNNRRGKRSERTTDPRRNNVNEGTSTAAPPAATDIPDTITDITTEPNAESDSDLSFLNEFANTDISVIGDDILMNAETTTEGEFNV